jgi:hypothetical protein
MESPTSFEDAAYEASADESASVAPVADSADAAAATAMSCRLPDARIAESRGGRIADWSEEMAERRKKAEMTVKSRPPTERSAEVAASAAWVLERRSGGMRIVGTACFM